MLFAFADPKSSGFLKRQVKVSGVGVIALGGDRYFGSSVCQFLGSWGIVQVTLFTSLSGSTFPERGLGST